MIWRQRELTLKQMLSDSIVTALMQADGVDPGELEAMLMRIGQGSQAAQRPLRWRPWSCRPGSAGGPSQPHGQPEPRIDRLSRMLKLN